MLTYQVRERIFLLDEDVDLDFPVDAEIVLTLAPEQPFGISASGGRTVRQDVAASVHYDGNNGRMTLESKEPLEPLRNLSTTMGHSTGLIREQCPVW